MCLVFIQIAPPFLLIQLLFGGAITHFFSRYHFSRRASIPFSFPFPGNLDLSKKIFDINTFKACLSFEAFYLKKTMNVTFFRYALACLLLNILFSNLVKGEPTFSTSYQAVEQAFKAGDWEEVERIASQNIELAASANEPRWEAHFTYLLGGSKVYQSLLIDAKPLLEKALEQEAALPDSILCNIYYYMSTIYSYEDMKISRHWLAKAMENPWGQTPSKQMRFMARMGGLIANEGNYDSAIHFYKKSVYYGLLLSDSAAAGRMTGNVGIMFTATSQIDSAQFYSQQAIRYLEGSNKEGKNNRHLGFAYIQMGDILNDYEASTSVYNESWVAKAQEYYEKGATLLLKSKALRDQMLAHQSLATVHREREEFAEARTHLNQALSLARKTGIRPQEAEYLMELGDLAKREKDHASAQAFFEEAIPIMDEVEEHYSTAIAYQKAGTAANQLGKYNQAATFIEEAIRLQTEFEFTGDLKTSYKAMAQARAGQKRFDEAYEYMTAHEKLKDSLFNEEKNLQITEMETQYQTAKKDLELAQNEKKISLRDTQVMGLGIIAGLLLLAGLGAFFAYRRIVFQKKKIEQQSFTLAQNLREKEVLLKEIHHRVKNNLQTISSLLKLQARNVKDKAALEPLMEGRNRVKSMALIHQKLYQTEGLKHVDFQDYLLQLSNALAHSYKTKGRDIQTHVQAPDISMDIDTAVPLGLIVNELLSNAYKYAFEGRAEGNIRLAIKRSKQAGEYKLTVTDDGVGLPDDFDPEKTTSLGMQLVQMFTEQLDGSLDWVNEQGTKFVLTFSPIFQEEVIG